jgi:hypothetical protein
VPGRIRRTPAAIVEAIALLKRLPWPSWVRGDPRPRDYCRFRSQPEPTITKQHSSTTPASHGHSSCSTWAKNSRSSASDARWAIITDSIRMWRSRESRGGGSWGPKCAVPIVGSAPNAGASCSSPLIPNSTAKPQSWLPTKAHRHHHRASGDPAGPVSGAGGR